MAITKGFNSPRKPKTPGYFISKGFTPAHHANSKKKKFKKMKLKEAVRTGNAASGDDVNEMSFGDEEES